MTNGAKIEDDLDECMPLIAVHGVRATSMSNHAEMIAEVVARDDFVAHICSEDQVEIQLHQPLVLTSGRCVYWREKDCFAD